MSSRASQVVLLCEDEAQWRLVRKYMERCGRNTKPPRLNSKVASWEQSGGNVHWVLRQFPKELHACRQRNKRTRTLLIVVVDADNLTVEQRRAQLVDRVTAAGYDQFDPSDPAVILIPKRHIETWIRALLGDTVTEEQDCKPRKKHEKETLRRAGETLFEWSRPNATPGPTCVPSLSAALPEWRKIDQRQ